MNVLSVIADIAVQNGCDEVGVCRFDIDRRPLLPCRAASRLPEGARTVIVTLFPYAVDSDRERNISRYAAVPDYHKAAGEVLCRMADVLRERFPDERFEPFVDNSPLREVACAVAAGLGVQGDNGLLINDRFGSYVFIGCIVTTLDAETSEQHRECLHCGACAAACLGGCLPDSRDTCLSTVSQKKGTLTADEQALLLRGGSLWGCDRCQEVCPLNEGKETAPHRCFSWYEPWLCEQSLDDLTDKAYGWRGKAVLYRNIQLFQK